MSSHYMPGEPLRLEAIDRRDNEWLIGFGPIAGDVSLFRSGNLAKAAARLFEALHRADAVDVLP
ncbi:hypothetical protein [Sphingomonas oryzagri]